jgi:phospholipase C
LKKITFVSLVLIAVLGVAACSNGASSSIPSSAAARQVSRFSPLSSGSTPIQHIVLIVQENRTMNNLFATFHGANGATVGYELVSGQKRKITLKEVALAGQQNLNHSYGGFLQAYNNGAMDGFNLVKFPSNGRTEKGAPYVYVNPGDIAPYWTMAEQYGLANNMFTTQGSASFPAHQDLIRGGTCISSAAACSNPSSASVSLIDNPPYGSGAWGCDSTPGTVTSLITNKLRVERGSGPFPCTSVFPYYPYSYETLRDLLDGRSLSWKYYTPALGSSGQIWNAFDVIAPVRNGPEWNTNVSSPETNIFSDISNGTLANMSWVIPDGANSDHPEKCGCDTGPSWVASVVNAIGNSQYWNSTAIIITWDDWGGFFDNVTPPLPRDNQGGPGLRVPLIVVSPYSKIGSGSQGGYISNTFYEFGSIIRYVEDNFNLGRLGTTDGSSNSISDMLDYNQSPRQFQTIGSKYSRSFFLHRKPSRLPVDEQ